MSAHTPVSVASYLPELPGIPAHVVPGSAIVERAVSVTLGILVVLAGLAAYAAVGVQIRITDDGDGTIEPSAVVAVRGTEGGVIAAISVRTGDTVRKGQPLASLDALTGSAAVFDLERQLEGARIDLHRLVAAQTPNRVELEAAVTAADARVLGALATLRQRMVEFGVQGDPDSIARQAATRIHIGLDQAASSYIAAKAGATESRAALAGDDVGAIDVDRKRADITRLTRQLEVARQHLERQTIYAPSAGVVLTEDVDKLVGSAIAPGQTLLEIADLSFWRARLTITEHDVHEIQVGDVASIEIPALSAETSDRFEGRVVEIASQPVALSTSGTSTRGYDVDVSLDSSTVRREGGNRLKRGYAAHGKIIVRSGRVWDLAVASLRARERQIVR